MKRYISFMLSICLILPCAMFFVGCFNNPAGTYHVTEYTVGSKTYTRAEFEEMEDGIAKSAIAFFFAMEMSLNDDGTFSTALATDYEGDTDGFETATGTWTLEDGVLTMTIGKEVETAKYEDGKIIVESSTTKMVYAKKN